VDKTEKVTVWPGIMPGHCLKGDYMTHKEKPSSQEGLPAAAQIGRFRQQRWYHAAHEASHAVIGIANGLKPKQMTVGNDPLGTQGGTDFSRALSLRIGCGERISQT
jgi:hypothetical protein